jgi:hypothetical protein
VFLFPFIEEVRHNVSLKYIGAWRNHAKHLKPFIVEMKKHLPKLRKLNALPYANEINWEMDVNFAYPTPLEKKSNSDPTAPISSVSSVVTKQDESTIAAKSTTVFIPPREFLIVILFAYHRHCRKQ